MSGWNKQTQLKSGIDEQTKERASCFHYVILLKACDARTPRLGGVFPRLRIEAEVLRGYWPKVQARASGGNCPRMLSAPVDSRARFEARLKPEMSLQNVALLHGITWPPVTKRFEPVRKEDSGPRRKATVLATSSRRARRFKGVRLASILKTRSL